MAKPKHPTSKTVRQGQTVYHVVDPKIWAGPDGGPKFVKKYHLYSHKTDLPPRGERIEKMPVSRARKAFGRVDTSDIFYSKKRAETAAKIRSEHA